MGARVWEVDSSPQTYIWEQLCPGPGLKMGRPQHHPRASATGFSHLASPTGESTLVGALLPGAPGLGLSALGLAKLYVAAHLIPELGLDTKQGSFMSYPTPCHISG